ncbi:uncharacterized protein LOC6530490 [Drosophila yakuba]|uniref:Ionotropic glutamate receptor C-terminal domain-containing protein n=1 Tax=Drosophila yakuba TaxID=7245 RepID=B4P7U1_DROYA|nr:uncharacterized protein LOC6530490 [Drosophila yakuba]EDW91117.2 uncharacterized protein Dyak_GE13635 [Drosophila yakuba]
MYNVLVSLLLLSTRAQMGTSTRGSYNITLLRSVLTVIRGREHWKNTPIFLGSHTNSDDLNTLMIWLQYSMEVTCHTVDTSTAAHYEKPLGHFNIIADNSVSLLFCQSSQELIWFNMDKRLRRLRSIRLIVILSNKRSESYKAIMGIFKRLWHFQFLKVIVLHRDRVYSYTPYPVIRFFKLDPNYYPLFPQTTNNFQGYVVSTPVENDIPRVFFVHDQKTGSKQIRGFGYRTFVEYLHRHNGSLHVINAQQEHAINSSVNMGRIMKQIVEGQLEISLHPYVDVPENEGDHSYPLLIATNCLIVPVRNEISRYMYLLLPLNQSSWILLLGSVVYISGVLYYIQPGLEHRSWGQRIGLNILDSISRIIYICSPSRTYNPPLRYFIVSVHLSILGFVVTNLYSIMLGSFFTTLVVGEQVDSMEQLIRQQQKVLVKYYEVSTLLRHVEPDLVDGVAQLLVGVNASEQVSALLGFNRSYAYPFTLERWEFFSLQQQYAFKPIFRFSSACLGSPIIGYPMRRDCHLQPTLNIFIMRIQDAGLLQHWKVSDFNDAMRAGYVRLLENFLGFHALDVDSLRLGWAVLICGWLLSTVIFLCERRRICH